VGRLTNRTVMPAAGAREGGVGHDANDWMFPIRGTWRRWAIRGCWVACVWLLCRPEVVYFWTVSPTVLSARPDTLRVSWNSEFDFGCSGWSYGLRGNQSRCDLGPWSASWSTVRFPTWEERACRTSFVVLLGCAAALLARALLQAAEERWPGRTRLRGGGGCRPVLRALACCALFAAVHTAASAVLPPESLAGVEQVALAGIGFGLYSELRRALPARSPDGAARPIGPVDTSTPV
jgi:hypothetical protein